MKIILADLVKELAAAMPSRSAVLVDAAAGDQGEVDRRASTSASRAPAIGGHVNPTLSTFRYGALLAAPAGRGQARAIHRGL